MFLILLIVTFILSVIVSLIIVKIFNRPIENILNRIISDSISQVWSKYLYFAILVTGISNGVRIWDLEKYITANHKDFQVVELNFDRWVLEIYRTIIGSLQGIAWMLLVFFIFALIAFVIVRVAELKKLND
ncbi:MAG: hypothetical protein H8E60_01135 [Candidatus Marinimicrobia bacterium]|nr:hypothetical protein [Candidatus Neomarinimicrobiota bacterium]